MLVFGFPQERQYSHMYNNNPVLKRWFLFGNNIIKQRRHVKLVFGKVNRTQSLQKYVKDVLKKEI